MSDFTSGFWSVYITVITIVSIAACGWLVWVMSSARGGPGAATTETTGHTWDGDLAEYNNPLPRWWLWLFVITLVFGAVYLVMYPGLGTMKGVFGWTSAGQYRQEVDEVNKVVGPLYDKFLKQDLKAVAADPQALAIGERLFLNSCAQCHGSDAGGSRGFPSLRDAEWLYGGEPQQIEESILKGRNGVMPPFGQALGEEGTRNVVHYVRSLSGLAHDGLKAQLGKAQFSTICAACHGPEGKGNPALGAPDLTNKVWLWGSSEKDILETVTKGRRSAEGSSAMPAHASSLGEAKVHILAAYVWSLSNKPAAAAKQ
jgi:cytochrome c oxidase cbb3-type subunit 3